MAIGKAVKTPKIKEPVVKGQKMPNLIMPKEKLSPAGKMPMMGGKKK